MVSGHFIDEAFVAKTQEHLLGWKQEWRCQFHPQHKERATQGRSEIKIVRKTPKWIDFFFCFVLQICDNSNSQKENNAKQIIFWKKIRKIKKTQLPLYNWHSKFLSSQFLCSFDMMHALAWLFWRTHWARQPSLYPIHCEPNAHTNCLTHQDTGCSKTFDAARHLMHQDTFNRLAENVRAEAIFPKARINSRNSFST